MSPKRVPSAPPGIPGYTYVSLLGSGGFADVFLYEQHRPRRRVAVKVLLQDMLSTDARQQFDAEANLMAQLSTHPSIVTIYEANIATDGRPYLAMEYCSRPNLGVSYRREQISVADALRIGIQVAGAVETAHRAGILHRDIKPANVLVTEYNRPALTDFGISATTDESSMPAEGMSIPWSPPESFAEPARSGLTTDVWALAATIYTLLAGRSPFEIPGGANSGADLISRIERTPLVRIARADVPDSLQRVLATAMAKSAQGRYATALTFARALQQVQTELRFAVTTVDVIEDVLVADVDEDDDPGTRIRSIVSIDPTAPGAGRTGPGAARTPAPPTVAPMPPAPSESVIERTGRRPAPLTERLTGAGDGPDRWPGPLAAPLVEATMRRAADDPGEPPAEPEVQTGRRRAGVWVAASTLVLAIGAIGAVVLQGGDTPSAAGPSAGPEGERPVDPVGSIVPAAIDLVGAVVGTDVTFTWGNPSPQTADSYLWRVPDEFGEGTFAPISDATVSVPASATGKTCLEVLIVRSGKSSLEPARGCVP